MFNLDKIKTNDMLKGVVSAKNNMSDFIKSFGGNISSMRLALEIKDLNGEWHKMTQRIFKNGSVHISTK